MRPHVVVVLSFHGYDDTMRRDAEVHQFFDHSEGRIHA